MPHRPAKGLKAPAAAFVVDARILSFSESSLCCSLFALAVSCVTGEKHVLSNLIHTLVEIYNYQAYSSLFEDQMVKEICSQGQFPVFNQGPVELPAATSAASSNKRCHATTTVCLTFEKSDFTMKLKKSETPGAVTWAVRSMTQSSPL